MKNKHKIINDPVYGFLQIPSPLVFDVIQHPYFQRLRRIKQLGLAELVYPGAVHSRFQHALGAMHLMGEALDVLRSKGHVISNEEKESAQLAILLHDLGHGPFSHVLEKQLLHHVSHEWLSLQLMRDMNESFSGQLTTAIAMFEGTYPRPFFHQLISGQLDMDRMDYLKRDSFFTGVVEGTIGVERIIKMLQVFNDQLVVEEKGLLSVENFLNARRLMYWQVYLHRTAIAAESMLTSILDRVRWLVSIQQTVFLQDPLRFFLTQNLSKESVHQNPSALFLFSQLDDLDVLFHLKKWQFEPDAILSYLAKRLVNRELFSIELTTEPQESKEITFQLPPGFSEEARPYFFRQGKVSNKGYLPEGTQILILRKNREVVDISEASDLPTIKALSHIVKKYYVSTANPVSL
ncbi:MAG: HD domain-containing protein [Spirosomataceae bacterium]